MYYQTATLVAGNRQQSVNRPYWGCSSSASSTDAGAGTTGLWWSATYIDLLGKGAATSSSSFDHITVPGATENLYFYDIQFAVYTATTGELYLQVWPVGASTATIRPILSTGGDITLNKMYQITVPIEAGADFTVGMSAAASTGQYSLYIQPSVSNIMTKL